MRNNLSLEAVSQSSFGEQFCKPLYASYCFSRIPATIETLLTGKALQSLPPDTIANTSSLCDQVVLFFIDGFGWQFYEHYLSQYPFLQHFENNGVVSKITSQFPSTTAAHVTCMHTDQPVNIAGNYEWFHYDPNVDAMISPLIYSFAGDRELGTLKQTGVSPNLLYPTNTFYEKLKEEGIESFVFQHQSIAFSTYSQAMCKGSTIIPYNSFPEALTALITMMEERKGLKSYYFVYYSDIDSTGHNYGTFSPQFHKAVDVCFNSLEDIFWPRYQKNVPNSAILLTADHGQVMSDPKQALYINKLFPEIIPLLKTNKQGKLLAPAGSPRDFFLHVKDDKLTEVEEHLKEVFKGKAEVYRTEKLLESGIFGLTPPSQRFLERVGNLVILPYENESVFWFEEGKFWVKFLGNHGGLTRREMETIFLYLKN